MRCAPTRYIAGAALAVLAAALASQPARAGFDAAALYGDGLSFDVRRGGRPVGRHDVRFEPRPDGALAVTAASRIEVTLLGLTVYRFSYRSSSLWRDGEPVAVDAATDDGGDASRVRARLQGGLFVVEADGRREAAAAPVFPTDHWHPGVLGRDRVLNTITGRIASVTLLDRGPDLVETGDGPRPARRWDYEGDLRASVWYDDEGRWVGLRFVARDGSTIDYVCRRCGPGGNHVPGGTP